MIANSHIKIAAILVMLTLSLNLKSQTSALSNGTLDQTSNLESEENEEICNYDFLYGDVVDDLNLKYDHIAVDGLLGEAMTHIGARYRSGSKGPGAFDCSGFTSYVFRQVEGTNIGASSRDQYARNFPISRSEMQPGDLVFFTSPSSGRKVGHVGIVVDVDPATETFNFIHASSRDGVRISNSNEGFYARRFIGVRRVL